MGPIAIIVCPNANTIDFVAKSCRQFLNIARDDDKVLQTDGTFSLKSITVKLTKFYLFKKKYVNQYVFL